MLYIRLTEPSRVKVGRLGTFDLPAGLYVYVGSAFGPGGLKARLGRHFRRVKSLRWHIDYLTAIAEPEGALAVPFGRLESIWASKLCEYPAAAIPVPGFGAGDAGKGECGTHLFAFPDDTDTAELERWLMEYEMLSPLDLALDDDEKAEEAVQGLVAKFESELKPYLFHWLACGDADRRWWAVRGLSLIGGKDAESALEEVASSDRDEGVRAGAIFALGDMKSAGSIPTLIDLLGDPDSTISSSAADALIKLIDAAVQQVSEALLEGDDRTRVKAAYILKRTKPEGAVNALFHALYDDNYLVQSMAEETLLEMGYLNNFIVMP